MGPLLPGPEKRTFFCASPFSPPPFLVLAENRAADGSASVSVRNGMERRLRLSDNGDRSFPLRDANVGIPYSLSARPPFPIMTPSFARSLLLVPMLAAGLALSGCSPVKINGSYRTDDNQICLVVPRHVQPDVHEKLVELLRKKEFEVREYPADTSPGVCRQTLLYAWDTEQYYLPAYVKQHAINLDLYVEGQKYANASFDPRRLYTPQVKFIPFSRYLARVLDRLFPGRQLIGA